VQDAEERLDHVVETMATEKKNRKSRWGEWKLNKEPEEKLGRKPRG